MTRFLTSMLLAAFLVTGVVFAGQVRIGFVTKAMDSEFWLTVKNGALEAVKENPEIELLILSPDREVNVQQQIQIIDDLIIQGLDALCVAPSGAKEVAPSLEKAHEEGIKVVVFDSDSPQFTNKVSFVGTNNIVGGGLAAEYITKRLNGKGKVGIIMGIMGHQTAMDRLKGAEDKFKDAPGIDIVAKQSANWERATAMSVMEDILSSNPDLDAIFCSNDLMAMGAAEAVLASEAKTFIIGFDANLEALRATKDPASPIAGTVAQNSFNIGKFAVETAYKACKGLPVNKNVDTGTELVSVENVDQYLK